MIALTKEPLLQMCESRYGDIIATYQQSLSQSTLYIYIYTPGVSKSYGYTLYDKAEFVLVEMVHRNTGCPG